MLPIRALVLTRRWDERLTALHRLDLHDARSDWRWLPQELRSAPECADTDTG